MNNGEDSENLNDWEQVKFPFIQIESSTIQSRNLETVVIRNNYLQNERSVFPPSHHDEGLQINPQQPNSPPLSSSSSTSSPSSPFSNEGGRRSDSGVPATSEIGRRLWLRFEVLSSKALGFVSSVYSCVVLRSGVLSVASATAVVVAVSLLYMRMRRWRRRIKEDNKNRLILLLREKDEKISQLLLHIAQMKELLSSRRRVPIIRIG